MIEVRIICSKDTKIGDLNLDLKRGQVIWISDQLARQSKDLRQCVVHGDVRMDRVDRSRIQTPARRMTPSPPSTWLSHPRGVLVPHSQDPTPVVEAPPKANDSVAQDRINEALERAHRAEESFAKVSSLLERLVQSMERQSPIVQQFVVQGGNVPTGTQHNAPRIASDEPVYIPSKILDTNIKSDIKVSEDKSDQDEGVKDAAKALKALRKRKSS